MDDTQLDKLIKKDYENFIRGGDEYCPLDEDFKPMKTKQSSGGFKTRQSIKDIRSELELNESVKRGDARRNTNLESEELVKKPSTHSVRSYEHQPSLHSVHTTPNYQQMPLDFTPMSPLNPKSKNPIDYEEYVGVGQLDFSKKDQGRSPPTIEIPGLNIPRSWNDNQRIFTKNPEKKLNGENIYDNPISFEKISSGQNSKMLTKNTKKTPQVPQIKINTAAVLCVPDAPDYRQLLMNYKKEPITKRTLEEIMTTKSQASWKKGLPSRQSIVSPTHSKPQMSREEKMSKAKNAFNQF